MSIYSKTDMIKDVAVALNFNQTSTRDLIDAVIAKITERASAGDTVNISGLGRFAMKTRKARIGRNPATGEPIQIAESRALGFKPSKSKS